MPTCNPRTDVATVQSILGVTIDAGSAGAFIQTASIIIDSIVTCATAAGVSDEALITAEGWLAAHLLSSSGYGDSVQASPKERERFENYDVTWAKSKVQGQGVLSTVYGQAANALTKGCLKDIDKDQSAIYFTGSVG